MGLKSHLLHSVGIFSRLVLLLAILTIASSVKLHASMSNTMTFQSKIVVKTTGQNVTTGSPACISAGADTCDFRVRIWNLSSGGTATAGNNMMFEELINNVEIGDSNGEFILNINSVCAGTQSGTHAWSTTVASSTVCNIFDDNGDADSVVGVNFDRSDLYLEITFDPSGTWTSLASPPGGIETFTRTSLVSVPTAYVAQSLGGIGANGFVQLSPSAVQNTSDSTGAIRVNEQGIGNLIDLQQGGTDKFVLNNNGQLQLSQTGSTGGLLLGGDTNLYRSASGILKTDNSLTVGTNLAVLGLSDFSGNLRNVLTVSDGSTTATGSGSSSRTLTVSSTTNFNVGNIVLVNGSTYARIDSIDSSTQMTITPGVTWSNGNTVVEYTASKIGGDGSTLQQQFDTGYFNNGIRAGGGSTGTTYNDQLIQSNRGIRIEGNTNGVDIDSQANVNINTSGGLVVTKNESNDVAGAWSSGTTGGTARSNQTAVVYNGKMYNWGGFTSVNVNTFDIYDFNTGTWSTTASAGGTARRLHTAVVYNNKMYAWGGINSGGTTINTLDIYNFITDSWTTGTAGGTARNGHTAVVFNNKMYAWGGLNTGGTTINTLDIYDFATDSWTTGLAGGTARTYQSAVVYNSKIYFWGGCTTSACGAATINTLDIYDIQANTWTTGATGGTARNLLSAQVYNNKMYSWSGRGTAGSSLATMDVYDFGTNTWSAGTSGGVARNSYSEAVYNNKMFAWGGINGGNLSSLSVYDFGIKSTVLQINSGNKELLRLDTNNILTLTTKPLGLQYITNDSSQYTSAGWSTATSGGTGRASYTAVLYNKKMYNWAGCTTAGCSVNDMDIYDFTTNTWSTGATGGRIRYDYAAVTYNGKIYYWSGFDNNALVNLNTLDIYDIATNSWTTGTSGGTIRNGARGVAYNGKLYFWAGISAGTLINTMDVYDIATGTWSVGTAGGVARAFYSAAVYNGKLYAWGGCNGASCLTFINSMSIYDFTTKTWSVGTAGGTAREYGVGGVFNGKWYNWSGSSNGSTGINTMDVFDFERNVWSVGTAGGTARWGASGVIYSGKLFGYGGFSGPFNFDYYDIGSSKSEDVFYIQNAQGAGPDDGKLFRFDAGGRAYTSKQGGWFSVGADYAEYMYTNDETLEAGDLIKLDPTVTDKSGIKKEDKVRDNEVIGVISSEPGFVGNITDISNINNNNPNWKLVSMVGQVKVKVNTEKSTKTTTAAK